MFVKILVPDVGHALNLNRRKQSLHNGIIFWGAIATMNCKICGSAFVVIFQTIVMKRMILCTAILFLAMASKAQTKQTSKTKTPSAKAKTQTKAKTNAKKTDNSNTTALTSVNAFQAKANTNSTQSNFIIGDPIVLALDARAAGADIKISKSGIVGMPKRAYGFANGRLFFGTTSSVTSGTQTGSGGVGTGTSLGTFGSISPVMGVNGKSPYAGSSMWGNATNLPIGRGDSAIRRNSAKQ